MLKYHNIAFEYHLQISVSVTMVTDNIVILKVIKLNVVFFLSRNVRLHIQVNCEFL